MRQDGMTMRTDQTRHEVGVGRADYGQLNVYVVVFHVLRRAGVGVY